MISAYSNNGFELQVHITQPNPRLLVPLLDKINQTIIKNTFDPNRDGRREGEGFSHTLIKASFRSLAQTIF